MRVAISRGVVVVLRFRGGSEDGGRVHGRSVGVKASVGVVVAGDGKVGDEEKGCW